MSQFNYQFGHVFEISRAYHSFYSLLFQQMLPVQPIYVSVLISIGRPAASL
jgi:hypothetical protein